MVEVRIAGLDERHHVMLGVDVEPDAGLAEPVGDPHPEDIGVERDVRPDVAGEAVDVTEAAGTAEVHRRRRPGVLRPPLDVLRRGAMRQELYRTAVGVAQPERLVALVDRDSRCLELRPCVVEREPLVQPKGDVVVAGVCALDELQGVRLVVAREERAPRVALPLGQAELQAPSRHGLVQIGDPQRHVVDAREANQEV